MKESDPALSQEITRLADDWLEKQQRFEDPAWQEAEEVRTLLQGLTLGSFLRPDGIRDFVKIADVHQGMDDASGLYRPFFVVETMSGIKVRISFEAIARGVKP